eukprot:m.67908 g.67908  ORF g.67908 m.67908 type:complete len:466 (-) comp11919_c0_seq1:41-1438(-)
MGSGASTEKSSANKNKGKKGEVVSEDPDVTKKRASRVPFLRTLSRHLTRKTAEHDLPPGATLEEMELRDRAIRLIQRNVRAWKTRRNMQERLKQKKAREAARKKALFKEFESDQQKLKARAQARQNRLKQWDSRKKKLEQEQKEIEERKKRLAKEEEEREKAEAAQEIQDAIDELAKEEQASKDAGVKNPHIIMIGKQWSGNGRQITAPHVTEAFTKAVREKGKSDDLPIKTIVFDWDMETADLLELIRKNILSEHEGTKAASLTLLIPHSYGSLFFLKQLPSTQVGILGGTWKNGEQISEEGGSLRVIECRFFWNQLADLLSVLPEDLSEKKEEGENDSKPVDPLQEALSKMKDPDSLDSWLHDVEKKVANVTLDEEKKITSREGKKVTLLLGKPLGFGTDESAGTKTIAAMKKVFLNADVTSPSDGSDEAKHITNNLFQPDLYEEAVAIREKMFEDNAVGLFP